MDFLEWLCLVLAVITFPVWLPIVEIQNRKRCPHFDKDCPGSYAFHGNNSHCGMFNARHECLHYWKLAEINAQEQR